MATTKCPQCGNSEVQTYSNGLLLTHRDDDGSRCDGSLNHPEDLPLKEGERAPYHWVPGLNAEFNP